MDKIVLSFWIYMIMCLSTEYGLPCTCGNIQEGQELECHCYINGAVETEWYKRNTRITRCLFSACTPNSVSGYLFSRNRLTISTFSFTNCKRYYFKETTTNERAFFPYCPVLTMTKPTEDDRVNILENTTEEFVCKMSSDYPAGTIDWFIDPGTPNDLDDDVNIANGITIIEQSPTDNQEYIATSTLMLSPARVYSGNTIYCNATNKPEQATLISHLRLNIVYGPEILPMANQSIEEGKPYVYNCLYIPGNPKATSVKWTRDEDNKEWITELLAFVNVSKDDRMMYTCTVENTIEPTNQSPVTVSMSGSFYLDVKYRAYIEEFVVEDYIGNEVTVEEFTSPILVCKVDSYPASSIKVLFQDKTLAESPSTLQLKHQRSNVSCSDIGFYTCIGSNYLNTQTLSTQDVVLFVKCRPQPYGDVTYSVYSAQSNTATLRLYAKAYPTVSSVVWEKDETKLQNSTKLTLTMVHVISKYGYIDIVQLELIIHNINELDYGEYKVQIRNDVGTMEKTFILIAEEILDPAGANIGMIVGSVVGSIVFVGLIVSAVVFLLRRHRTTSGMERETNTNLSNEWEEPPYNQRNSGAIYYNCGRVTNFETLNHQNQDVSTYSSPSCSNDSTRDCPSGEDSAYAICE